MNVSLTAELEEFVGSKVRSGTYHTASEVIREAAAQGVNEPGLNDPGLGPLAPSVPRR